MAAGVGLGDGTLGTRHGSGRGPPGRPPHGSAGGEGQEALRPPYENDREVARLGATLRLPDGCAGDPSDRVRALLSRLGRLNLHPPSDPTSRSLPNRYPYATISTTMMMAAYLMKVAATIQAPLELRRAGPRLFLRIGTSASPTAPLRATWLSSFDIRHLAT